MEVDPELVLWLLSSVLGLSHRLDFANGEKVTRRPLGEEILSISFDKRRDIVDPALDSGWSSVGPRLRIDVDITIGANKKRTLVPLKGYIEVSFKPTQCRQSG